LRKLAIVYPDPSEYDLLSFTGLNKKQSVGVARTKKKEDFQVKKKHLVFTALFNGTRRCLNACCPWFHL
jgi:hypothetical protein